MDGGIYRPPQCLKKERDIVIFRVVKGRKIFPIGYLFPAMHPMWKLGFRDFSIIGKFCWMISSVLLQFLQGDLLLSSAPLTSQKTL